MTANKQHFFLHEETWEYNNVVLSFKCEGKIVVKIIPTLVQDTKYEQEP
jgi:hypothetical protein